MIFLVPIIISNVSNLSEEGGKPLPNFLVGAGLDLFEFSGLHLNVIQKNNFAVFSGTYETDFSSGELYNRFLEPSRVIIMPSALVWILLLAVPILFLFLANFILSRKEIY